MLNRAAIRSMQCFWLQHAFQHAFAPQHAMFCLMRGIALVMLMAGCAEAGGPAYQVIRNPGRPPIVVMQCESRFECFSLASHLCSHGYNIVDAGYQLERDENRLAQGFENYSASQQYRAPRDMSRSRVDTVLTVECVVAAQSEPPRITVTKNTPLAVPPSKTSVTEPGF